MDTHRPIGIFDSGIGGLTVANALLKACPNERLIYFGDTAHLPYGDKSPDLIKGYARKITEFLLEHDCKAIVIACNTASSVAFETVRETATASIPVFDVIHPVADHVIRSGYRRVGVIGTLGTIGSNVYYDRLKALQPDLKVYSLATPLLAPMIESGFIHGQISDLVISNYLNNDILERIEALILGCTHYPLIRKEIEAHYERSGQTTDVLATNIIVGDYVQRMLHSDGLLHAGTRTEGDHHFYVSDYTASFEQTTRLFYGSKVKLEQLRFW